MNNFRKVIEKLFSKYLIVTNTISCGGLLAIGDVITQRVEQMNPGERKKHNWHRTGRMLCMGFILGPFCHVWYGALDRFVLGGGGKVAIKKILADQTVAAPFFCSAFFMGMSLLEGKTTQEGVQEVKDKFLMVYMVDWCVWPPCQFINFYFLPTQFRVLYVSSITLCWNTFLSWIKHSSRTVMSQIYAACLNVISRAYYHTENHNSDLVWIKHGIWAYMRSRAVLKDGRQVGCIGIAKTKEQL